MEGDVFMKIYKKLAVSSIALLSFSIFCLNGSAHAESQHKAMCKKNFQLNAEDSDTLKHADDFGFETKNPKKVAQYDIHYEALKKQAKQSDCWVYSNDGHVARYIFSL